MEKNDELKAKLAAAEKKLASERKKADRTDWIGNDPPDGR